MIQPTTPSSSGMNLFFAITTQILTGLENGDPEDLDAILALADGHDDLLVNQFGAIWHTLLDSAQKNGF